LMCVRGRSGYVASCDEASLCSEVGYFLDNGLRRDCRSTGRGTAVGVNPG